MIKHIHDDIYIIENPKIPEELIIDPLKSFCSSKSYSGYRFKMTKEGLLYAPRKHDVFKKLAEYFKITKIVRLGDKVLFSLYINGKKTTYLDYYGMSYDTIFSYRSYGGKLGRTLIREYFYKVALLFFSESKITRY